MAPSPMNPTFIRAPALRRAPTVRSPILTLPVPLRTVTAVSDPEPGPSIAARLIELGLALPGPYPPHDPLDAVVIHGGVARTSGQLPRDAAGALVHPGRLGDGVTVEQGAEAARWCALNALSVLSAALTSLDRVERVLSVIGFVACTPEFLEQPAVVDGASRLLRDVFGDAGRHSRSAIGVAALPRGGAVEIEVAVALR
jgi:enamine deaminase RidA (YjgF/YER057c/UK114 family)